MPQHEDTTNHPHRDDAPPTLEDRLTSLLTGSNSHNNEHFHSIKQLLRAISSDEAKILALLTAKQPKATRIVLAIPTITRKGKIMANLELKNDTVTTIKILTNDGAGVAVPPPSGDTFTVTSSNPASLGAALSADGQSIVLTPLVQASPGIGVTVADSANLSPTTLTVDIVADLAPTNIVLDVADATTTAQATPTAPGP